MGPKQYQGVGDLAREGNGTSLRQPAFSLQHRGKRRALDELHRQVDDLLRRLAEVVDGRHVGMGDAAGIGCFPVEPADRIGIVQQRRVHDFQGTSPSHPDVFGQVNAPHAALA